VRTHEPVAASCASCLAWGNPYRGDLCRPCTGFAARNRTIDNCGACRRRQPLKKGHCRLCWCQARLDRPAELMHAVLLPYVRQVQHHQLFFAGMPAPRDIKVKPPRRWGVGRGAPGLLRKPAPAAAVRPRPGPRQLRLFDGLPRTYRYGQVDLRRQPIPDNPWLAWAQYIAHTLAEARGWSSIVRGELNRNLVMLLAGHAEGELIRYSDFHAVVRSRESCGKLTIEVLQTMGILLDDRTATFDTWLENKLLDLAPGIQQETRQWAHALHDGGPRTRIRDEGTVRGYLYALLPALQDWSARYDHLREVTRDDVLSYLTALRGHRRQSAFVAVRSLFGWTKRNGAIFTNPTSRITNGRVEYAIWQPLQPEQIARTIDTATTPHARVFVALCAIHAARPGDVRALRLADLDLGNRRLTIAGRTRPLDQLTHRVLTSWLTYRRERWPITANPHLLINPISAMGTGPVSHMWIKHTMRNLPANLERLRIDRQLEEALACGADPLHLAAVFDIADTTAIRYATSARQLLAQPHEDAPSPSPRTHGPTPGKRPDEPSGSP
jgi:integrase